MYAEQNGRNTWNDAGAGVTQREEDTGGAEKTVAVLTAAADCRCQFTVFCFCFAEIMLSADICDRTIGYAYNQKNLFYKITKPTTLIGIIPAILTAQ